MLVKGSERSIAYATCDPAHGVVHWRPVKSIWSAP
jgi:hypothetical protein